jgi:hypothetical protein
MGRFKNLLVYNATWNAALLDIQHGSNVGCAIASKTLVGPAQRVWCNDNIIQF